jgi:hypothetical protein
VRRAGESTCKRQPGNGFVGDARLRQQPAEAFNTQAQRVALERREVTTKEAGLGAQWHREALFVFVSVWDRVVSHAHPCEALSGLQQFNIEIALRLATAFPISRMIELSAVRSQRLPG